MPFVEPLTQLQAPQEAQKLLEAISKKYGKILNIFGTMAHQPDVLQGVVNINDGLQNDLPANLRELAYYKSSHINNCEYCSHYHKQAALKSGVSEEQLAAIGDYASSDLFSDVEKSVLAYAEQLTKDANVEASVVEEVKKHLSDKELVTLASAVALANFTNRFNHGLDIELP